VGLHLAAIARRAAEAGIQVDPDCGFVRCMFSDEDFEFFQHSSETFGCHCNAILDIGLDGSVIHCFPLAGQKVIQMGDEAVDSDLREELSGLMAPYRTVGIYKECSTCTYKHSAVCSGGCLAAVMQRFRQAKLNLAVPESFEVFASTLA
jgi:radical SAM protein with 4Fe4S-binding SPASM domain